MSAEKQAWVQTALEYAWQICTIIGGAALWVVRALFSLNNRLTILETRQENMESDVSEIKAETKIQTRLLWKMSGAMGLKDDSGGSKGD